MISKNLQILGLQPRICKSFSRSQIKVYFKVGQNFRTKIQFLHFFDLIIFFQISVKLKVKIGGNGRSGSPCHVLSPPQQLAPQSAVSKYANSERKLVRIFKFLSLNA